MPVSSQSNDDLGKIAKDYSKVLSAPFLPQPRINYIKSLLKDSPFEIIENDYALIVKVQGVSSQKLVFMSHLDHPGIVVKNRHEGICLGSLFPERLLKIISKNGSIPLDIYSPEGKLITAGKLIGLGGKFLQKAILDIPIEVTPNSVAYYQIGLFKEDKDFFYLYAADNDVPTICMLSLLQNLKSKPQFTLNFVFTFYEEVHQISSFRLAQKNLLHLTPQDLVLNLECKKIENHPLNPTQNHLDYESGPVLQPSEKDCLYGYKFNSPNQLEGLVLSICHQQKTKIQYGLGLGSTDARPFSNFRLTPNLCTLDVPNRFKHNCGEKGEVVLEKIYKKDLYAMYQIISSLSTTDKTNLDKALEHKTGSLSDRFKKTDSITDSKAMSRKILLNYRLDFANKLKIINKKYYQTDLLSLLLDHIVNLLSFPYYYLRLVVSKTLPNG